MDSTPDQPVPPPEEPHDPRQGPAVPPVPPQGPAIPPTPPQQPGQWQQPWQPPPGYVPGAWTPPPTERKGLSFGAGLGIGIAIGAVAHLIGIFAMFASLDAVNSDAGLLMLLWPFVLIMLAAAVMMFFRVTRSYATGILIVAAALWLVIIGPCIALLGGFG